MSATLSNFPRPSRVLRSRRRPRIDPLANSMISNSNIGVTASRPRLDGSIAPSEHSACSTYSTAVAAASTAS
ncbi:MAG: hypothetical protein M0Z51_14560 [Propionibacterium sp.]|nr:hypothetical protein [Propionibacterium sp.]